MKPAALPYGRMDAQIDLEVMRRDAVERRGDRPAQFLSLVRDPTAGPIADWIGYALAGRTAHSAADPTADSAAADPAPW